MENKTKQKMLTWIAERELQIRSKIQIEETNTKPYADKSEQNLNKHSSTRTCLKRNYNFEITNLIKIYRLKKHKRKPQLKSEYTLTIFSKLKSEYICNNVEKNIVYIKPLNRHWKCRWFKFNPFNLSAFELTQSSIAGMNKQYVLKIT